MLPALGLALLLQQPSFLGNTTPVSGDSTSYWQQRVKYAIVATLDEERSAIQATAELVYTNNSPDTLREMYVHQYLNAFRPGSKWSASDAHENRVRFQSLSEPNNGYERFTAAPLVDGRAVSVTYPGSPDSTVARFGLPSPLPPGGTVRVRFAWEARPSTVFRRQGRRGRTYDFAQWYPKVAVYDRGGWQRNALVPAGELYGEFGDYDVTLVVRNDQVLASTGVPVEGDPGWAHVSRTGVPRRGANAYPDVPAAPPATVGPGYRAVRWIARDVHHFAWSASTEYIYEGGVYVRPAPVTPVARRFATWDTVAVHVLWKPGDDSTWGRGVALRRTIDALTWLEHLYGPYAYPQVTNVHRLDRGATEFPMMIMNSTASYGLILHELGHIYTYGILANNEWRSGWLDEGFTDYQTYWAQGLTPQEKIATAGNAPPDLVQAGYRGTTAAIPGRDSADIPMIGLELARRTQPIGISAADFSEFSIYNEMVYDRARSMYAHLRDLMGDSTYVRFLHEYYDMWALRHVDERAIRTVAARVYGKDLGWFFDQWVHQTGLLDYSLNGASTSLDPAGRFVTQVEIEKHGEYAHPMPVGIHTTAGWSIARAHPELERQILQVVTAEEPDSIVIDPFHVTADWDRRNDGVGAAIPWLRSPRIVYDWPFIEQADHDHTLIALSPAIWPTGRQGVAIGVRARTNYLSTVDRYDGGIAYLQKNPTPVPGGSVSAAHRVQGWLRVENPYVPFTSRPLMGYRAGAAWLDGILKLDLGKRWDLSPFVDAVGPRIGLSAALDGAYPRQSRLLPEQWTNTRVSEGSVSLDVVSTPQGDGTTTHGSLTVGGGYADQRHLTGDRWYGRALGSVTSTYALVPGQRAVTVRLVGGWSPRAPYQRSLFASSRDPFETFTNDYFRSYGALLKQTNVNYRPLGGAGLRGYSPFLALDQVIGANGELSQKIVSLPMTMGTLTLSAIAFGDVAAMHVAAESPLTSSTRSIADGGVGVALRGRFYDRDIRLRLDFPVLLSEPGFGLGHASNGGTLAFRWAFSLNDIW